MGDVVSLAAYRAEHMARLLEQRIGQLLGRLSDAPEVATEIVRLRNEIWLIDSEDGDTRKPLSHPPALIPRKRF